MRKVLFSFFFLGFLGCSSYGYADVSDDDETVDVASKSSIARDWIHNYLSCFLVDTVVVWKNIFTLSSMKVATAAIPLYISVRPANKIIHSKFYDPLTHKNVKQPPKFFKEIAVADGIVAIPFVAFNLYGFLSKGPLEFRRVQVFNAGLVATWATKTVIKSFTHDDCYRPWHQDFSCTEQAANGFPSGHAAMIAYLATYWALEKGYKWGLPLGTYALYAMAINVVANNHYISQVFAGATIGVLFGVAAHHTFEQTVIRENLAIGFCSDSKGKPGFRLAYDF